MNQHKIKYNCHILVHVYNNVVALQKTTVAKKHKNLSSLDFHLMFESTSCTNS